MNTVPVRRLRLVTKSVLLVVFLAFVSATKTACAQSPVADSERQHIKDYTDARSRLSAKQRQLRERLDKKVSAELIKQAGNSREMLAADSISAKQDGVPQLRISLLTCGPGNEVYEYYGHSAIRVMRTDSTGLDVTFNYGVFDFSTSNFALKFAMGKTYYMCVGLPTENFMDSYRRSGRYVDEQVLNLTQTECRRIYRALFDNAKPENRTYLYNFLYDNCATRIRDLIERNIDGKLQYPDRPTERSFRDAIHFFCRNAKWAAFGQDLLLGSKADLPATGRDLQFAPLVLAQDLDRTIILGGGFSVHNFVLEKHRLLDPKPAGDTAGSPLSPSVLAALMLAAAVTLGIWEIRHRRVFWIADTVLLLVQGLAGTVVTFVFLFSVHPTVDSNWLVWILNPLPLVGIYWQIAGARRHDYRQYHIVAAPVLALFLLFSQTIPQQFNSATMLLALLMLIRSTTSIIVWLKYRKTAKTKQKP